MTKRNKIIYWIATIWLALGMLSSGIVQLLKMEQEVDLFNRLGYPEYFLVILGLLKILGVIVLLMPRYPLLKEWAYAGFFSAMAGAILSHIARGHTMAEIFPPVLLLLLTVTSWYFRPPDRKLILANSIR